VTDLSRALSLFSVKRSKHAIFIARIRIITSTTIPAMAPGLRLAEERAEGWVDKGCILEVEVEVGSVVIIYPF
jgi:hypothetical protein